MQVGNQVKYTGNRRQYKWQTQQLQFIFFILFFWTVLVRQTGATKKGATLALHRHWQGLAY